MAVERSSEVLPRAGDLLTFEEWLAAPESKRLECVEGVLVVAAAPSARHQRFVMRLCVLLDSAVGPQHMAVADVDLALEKVPPTVRQPDVVVATAEAYATGRQHFLPEEVSLVVEVLSPGTRRVDQVLKRHEYAMAAIPRYWIIDLEDGVVLLEYALDGGGYRLVDRHRGSCRLTIGESGVDLDLDALA